MAARELIQKWIMNLPPEYQTEAAKLSQLERVFKHEQQAKYHQFMEGNK